MFLSLPFLSSQLTRHIVHFCSVSNILDLRIIFHFSFILKFKKKERKKKILTPSSELKSFYLKEIFVENFASLESTLSPSLHLTPRLLNSLLSFFFHFSPIHSLPQFYFPSTSIKPNTFFLRRRFDNRIPPREIDRSTRISSRIFSRSSR